MMDFLYLLFIGLKYHNRVWYTPSFFNSAGMFWSNTISCTPINQPRAEPPMQAKYDTTKVIPLYYLTCTKLRLHNLCIRVG